MMPYLILFLWTIMPGHTAELHDFHVSKGQLRYALPDSTFQLTLHLFLDDLELALETNGAPKGLQLCTEKEHPEADQWISAYLEKHIRVEADDTTVLWQFIGKEISEDYAGVWCYLESAPCTPPEQLIINHTVLFEEFTDQTNLLQLIIPEHPAGYLTFHRRHKQSTWSAN